MNVAVLDVTAQSSLTPEQVPGLLRSSLLLQSQVVLEQVGVDVERLGGGIVAEHPLDGFGGRARMRSPGRRCGGDRGCHAGRKAVDQADDDLRAAVRAARDAGDSWATIGLALDTTLQAAYQRFGQVDRWYASERTLRGHILGTLCCDLAGFGQISVIYIIGIAAFSGGIHTQNS